MTVALRLLLAALATYRVARLIAYEDGPLIPIYGARVPLLTALRSEIANLDLDQQTGKPRFNLFELVQCPYCLGVWIAPAFALVAAFPSCVTNFILATFGIMGFQSFLLDLTRSKNA